MTVFLVLLIIHCMQSNDHSYKEMIRDAYISETLDNHEGEVVAYTNEILKKDGNSHDAYRLKIKALFRLDRNKEALKVLEQFETECNTASLACANPLAHIEICTIAYIITGKHAYLKKAHELWKNIYDRLKAEQIRAMIRHQETLRGNPEELCTLYQDLDDTNAELNQEELIRFYTCAWTIYHPKAGEMYQRLPEKIQKMFVKRNMRVDIHR
ncbi:MAG: hypothetical protein E3K37_02405 [Candidatus Kuenenia sp.]|nr:hypothetical protein [Candidatus Kuenenia hertensis]